MMEGAIQLINKYMLSEKLLLIIVLKAMTTNNILQIRMTLYMPLFRQKYKIIP